MTKRVSVGLGAAQPSPGDLVTSSPVEIPRVSQIDQGPEDEEIPFESGAAFPVVGVGASAGGLEALTLLLRALPVDTGAGFVIVQHLAPDHASTLAEILSRATKMSVCEVRDEPEVEPDHVYVIPPGRDMIIAGGKLLLLPQDRYARRRGIDQFFSSLAEDCGHKAIGVVLSGAMNDGTLGLEAIKAAGGITFAQNDSAQHDSMPRSAVASGCVDFVLPPEKIAGEIARIARHPHVAPESEAGAETLGHTRIAQIVHRATGVDFIHYKANTLLRRITRRMVLHKMETLKDYEEHLQRTPDEVEALFQDILISVTTFFRDPESFDALARTVFPKLFAGRTRQEPVRIWTLGCSTGEEAYSLAMVFTECAEAAGSDVPMQLFATDLNSACVGRARAGVYPTSIDQSVSPARLERFFTKVEAGYRIGKEIRERCIFSRHNALGDPPFSRIDLISCRNMLIYMEPVLQKHIMSLLHYALKPSGYLWLGRSETTGASRALFHAEDTRHKLFARRPGGSPPGMHFRPALGGGTGEPFLRAAPTQKETARADLPKEAERILLTKYTPPGVIISAAMEIVQFRGETGAFLAPAAGAPSLNLLKMLREGLLVGVRAAILRAGAEDRTIREERLRVRGEAGFRELAVEVVPIKAPEAKDSGFLVLFDEKRNSGRGSSDGREKPVAAESTADRQTTVSNDELVRLTQELAATREYLQSIVEQQEAANEELQSANEEAQSANEEMQSVNEELETSKEEIQSSNEELATVNDELNNRNLELNRVNDTLQRARDYSESIVANMRSPLVVLDAGLHVKTASAAFYETFHVEPATTEGRLIYNLDNGQWNIPALRTLLEELLPQTSQIDDYEVRHAFKQSGPRIMVLNAQRLAAAAEHELLIVLAIEDISERTRSEDLRREGQMRLRHAADAAGLTYVEVDFLRARWRIAENFAAVMGYEALPAEQPDAAASTGLLLRHVVSDDRKRVEAALQDFLGGKPLGRIDYRLLGDDQIERCIEFTWTSENGPDGKPVRAFATNLDITERKRAEEHSKLLMAEVNHRAKNLLAVVQAVVRQTEKHADPAIFVARLTERIDALTAGHDLLIKNSWQGVGVSDLVEVQLAHFKELIGARVLLDGPPMRLTPAAAQGIGMALHELATNASKYGALSNSEGRVHISWQVAAAPERTFTMRWLEDGGPRVLPPARMGFGQRVIVRMVELAVDGTVEVDYRESGFSWKLTAPAAEALELGRVASADQDVR
jgi:chemotaxis methyl-accepting protein methylase/two-component sensor histidine kinase/PAS domain-containing protein